MLRTIWSGLMIAFLFTVAGVAFGEERIFDEYSKGMYDDAKSTGKWIISEIKAKTNNGSVSDGENIASPVVEKGSIIFGDIYSSVDTHGGDIIVRQKK